MSGGHYDYAYLKIRELADNIEGDLGAADLSHSDASLPRLLGWLNTSTLAIAARTTRLRRS